MAGAMTLDEAKLILSEDDLSYLSISELGNAMNILRLSATGSPDIQGILDSVNLRMKEQDIFGKVAKDATFRDYRDANLFLGTESYEKPLADGTEETVSYFSDLQNNCKEKALANIQAKAEGKNSLENLSWAELAEIKAMIRLLDAVDIDTTNADVQEFKVDFEQTLNSNIEKLDKDDKLSTLDARDFDALKDFAYETNMYDADFYHKIELASENYAAEYDVLNDLKGFDAQIVNKNAIALHRVIGTTTLENISQDPEIENLFKSIQIPALDDKQEIAKDEDGNEKACSAEKKQEYIESLFASASAQVLKDNFNDPFFFELAKSEQKKVIENQVKVQIYTDVLTMYVASGINDGVSKILQEKLGLEEPTEEQKKDGSEAQFAYNQKLSGELSKAFADPDKMQDVMFAFNEYMETIASADGKIRVSPHQFLANQADKQVELKDFRARLQTLYKGQAAPAVGAIVARRHENKLQSVGEKVYGAVYGFAVGVKDFAKNNTGKAMEIAGTLGIAAGSMSLSVASLGQRMGWFGEGAQQFISGGIGTTLASAMVLHTAAKSLVYPVVTEWKAMANDKEFANKSFFAKYKAARAEAKKKDPDLNLNLYIAGAAVVTTVAGGFLMGPMGSRMAAVATIAVGNYIIKRRDYNRTKKLYEQTGDEKYRIALYGDKGSEDIQNATGLKKAWKKTMNWLGAKKNQKTVAAIGAISSIFGLGSRAMAAEHAGALTGVKTGSSTLDNVSARDSLGLKQPGDSLGVKTDTATVAKTPFSAVHEADTLGVKTDTLGVKTPTDTLGVKTGSSQGTSQFVKDLEAGKYDYKAPYEIQAEAERAAKAAEAAKITVPYEYGKAPTAEEIAAAKVAKDAAAAVAANSDGTILPDDKATVAETPTGKTPVTETPTGKTPVTETPTGKAPVTETPTGETPAEQAPSGKTPGTETPTSETPDATDMKVPAYNKDMGISQKQFDTLLSTRTEAEITKMYSNLTDDVMKKNFPNMTREQLMYKYNRLDAWTARVKSDGKGNLIPLLDKAGNPATRYQMDAEMKSLKKIIECGESIDEKSLKAATAGLGHIKTDGDTDLSGSRTSNRITKLSDEGCDKDNFAYGKGGNSGAPVKVNVTPDEVKEMPVLKMAGIPLEPAKLPTYIEPMNLTTPIAVPTAADHSYLYVPAAYGRELLVQGAFDTKGAPVLSGDAALDARTVWASPIDADKPKGNIQLTRYFNGEFIGNKSDVVKAKDLGQVIGVFDDANKAGEVVLEGKAKIAIINVATGNTSVEKINLNAKGMPNTFTQDMAKDGNIAADAGRKVNKVAAAAFAAKASKGH